MINLTFFREPYLAILMSIILLISSCSTSSVENEDNFEEYNITAFTAKHLEITNELLEILTQHEPTIDINYLSQQSESSSIYDIRSIYKRANFEDSETVSGLILDLHKNGRRFIKSNPEYSNLNEKEIAILFEEEMSFQLNNYGLSEKSGPCEDRKETSEYRCERNWVISMGTIITLAVVTGGTAYLASGVATGIFINCMEEAKSDYENCVNG